MTKLTSRRTLLPIVAGALAAAFGPARAAEEVVVDSVVPSVERELPGGRVTREQRTFGFVEDPSTPSRGVFSLGFRAGLGSGIPADRPLPADLTAGMRTTLGAAYGLTDRIAPFASASVGEAAAANLAAGVEVQVTAPGAPFRASLAGAAFREGEGGGTGGWLRAAASLDEGRLRVGANVQAEKVWASGRDRVDLLTTAGISWRVHPLVRIGAEYVGQDLEAAFESPEAEGGARHVAGPSVALDLDRGRYQVVVAGGVGLTAASPDALARVDLSVSF